MEINKENLIIYEKNNLVVIYNKVLGKHFIVSEEVYNFFKNASEEKITFEEFIDCFQDEEDRKYIKQVIYCLTQMGVFTSKRKGSLEKKVNFMGENIHFCITKRCNLKCKHCCASCDINRSDTLSTEQIKNITDIIEPLNPKTVVLTGGEPLIRDDFSEIVNYMKEKIKNICLVLSTNGTLIDDKNIDLIVEKFDRVEISLDGIDEETCSATRGKGIFGRVINSVKCLQKKGFYNIGLSMVFGDKNMNLSKQFRELNKSLNTRALERYFVPEGRGKENVLEYCSVNTNLPISIPKMLHKLYYDEGKRSKKISSCSCSAFKSQIYIDDDGSIYPCPSLIKEKYKIGSIFERETVLNIKDKNLDKIDAYKRFQGLYPFNFEKCSKCDVNIFCWNCPAVLDIAKEDEEDFKRWCSMMKPVLNGIVWDEGVI
jgi:radical SAM protein with 4Fe4S-binding SPASM domain